MDLNPEVQSWLLKDSDPAVQLLTYQELLHRPANDPKVVEARAELGVSGWTARILADQHPVGAWENFRGDGDQLYGPKYIATNWRLIVLAELGMSRDDPRIQRAADLLLRYWSGPGGSFGESGSELCQTGNNARMMLRFGYRDDPRVRAALDWLVRTQKEDGGWHCWDSTTGTLDAWEAMAAFAELTPEERTPAIRRAIERGAEFFLERELLREADGSTNLPWSRLHYPNHYYYDVLGGLRFLTKLGYGRDPRLARALDLLESKKGSDGRWTLESVHPDLEPGDDYHPRPPIYPFLLESVGLPSRWLTANSLAVLLQAQRL